MRPSGSPVFGPASYQITTVPSLWGRIRRIPCADKRWPSYGGALPARSFNILLTMFDLGWSALRSGIGICWNQILEGTAPATARRAGIWRLLSAHWTGQRPTGWGQSRGRMRETRAREGMAGRGWLRLPRTNNAACGARLLDSQLSLAPKKLLTSQPGVSTLAPTELAGAVGQRSPLVSIAPANFNICSIGCGNDRSACDGRNALRRAGFGRVVGSSLFIALLAKLPGSMWTSRWRGQQAERYQAGREQAPRPCSCISARWSRHYDWLQCVRCPGKQAAPMHAH